METLPMEGRWVNIFSVTGGMPRGSERMEGGKYSSPNNGPPGDGHVLTPGSRVYVLVGGQRDSPEGIH